MHKVGRDTANKWLVNMLKLVGLPPDVSSNRSGRATLITRMAAKGVPNEVGRLISGHHTTDGYLRYDRTQALKIEAATLVSANPLMNYEVALTEVSKKFVDEKIVGSSANLNPLKGLVDRVSDKPSQQLSMMPKPAQVLSYFCLHILFTDSMITSCFF